MAVCFSLPAGIPSTTPTALNRIDLPGTAEESWAAWAGLRGLPAADPLDWPSAVIVAAHPDDEILGVGGTMAMLAAAGARLRLIAVTDGEASHPGADPEAIAQVRTAESAAARHVLGVQDIEVIRLRLPDTGLTACEDELAARLRELFLHLGRGDDRQVVTHVTLPAQFEGSADDTITICEAGAYGDGTTRAFVAALEETPAAWIADFVAACPNAEEDAIVRSALAQTERHEAWRAVDPNDPAALAAFGGTER